MELEAQRKDEEGQDEEVIEKPERFTMQEMARGLSLFEEALFNFEAQNPNVKWYTRFRIQSSATMSPMPRKRKVLNPVPFFSCV